MLSSSLPYSSLVSVFFLCLFGCHPLSWSEPPQIPCYFLFLVFFALAPLFMIPFAPFLLRGLRFFLAVVCSLLASIYFFICYVRQWPLSVVFRFYLCTGLFVGSTLKFLSQLILPFLIFSLIRLVFLDSSRNFYNSSFTWKPSKSQTRKFYHWPELSSVYSTTHLIWGKYLIWGAFNRYTVRLVIDTFKENCYYTRFMRDL